MNLARFRNIKNRRYAMPKKFLSALILVVAAMCISCSSDDAPTGPQEIVGSGTPTQENRSVPPFHSIILRIPAEVNLTYGATQVVGVTIDDNLLEYLETVDSSGNLIIRFDDAVSISQYELTVELTMTDLQGITCESAGSITGTNLFDVDAVSLVLSSPGLIDLELDVNQLSSVISGAGNISLIGTSDVHNIVIAGTGNMKSFGLVVGVSNIVISGTGNAEVTVTNVLDVVISGIGSVYYKGHPTISQVITGTGGVFDSN
jgi:hypothetical protein